MDKPKDTRYWELTGPGPFDGVPADEPIYHVYTPLFRLIAAPEFGLVAELFQDTQGLAHEKQYNAITCLGAGYLRPVLLAETHFAYGRHERAVKILELNPFALETACCINVEHRGPHGLAEFVTLAQSIRARKLIEIVLSEIHRGV